MSSSTRTPFRASDFSTSDTHHLLLAATGSVATIKLPLILHALSSHPNLSIRLILTPSALKFSPSYEFPPSTTSPDQPPSQSQDPLERLLSIKNVDGIYLDQHEWEIPWTRTSPILHIELRRWAHLLVIAPLSANTLAKVVHGMSDNLLTSVVRAWDTTGVVDGPSPVTGKRKRIVVAPAMNTAMWRHPVTEEQIGKLEGPWGVGNGEEGEEGWFEVLRPQEKALACGDVGDGAMREWTEIVKVIEERLDQPAKEFGSK